MKKLMLLIITLFSLASTVPALAENVVNVDVPVSFLLPSVPCTGQDIAFAGSAHFLIGATANKNTFHLKVHANAQGIHGVGVDDNTPYQLNGAANLNLNLNGDGGNVDLVVNAGLLGQGQAGDARLHLLFHVTGNANGDVTVIFLKGNAECR